jgi:hypothetical protein
MLYLARVDVFLKYEVHYILAGDWNVLIDSFQRPADGKKSNIYGGRYPAGKPEPPQNLVECAAL